MAELLFFRAGELQMRAPLRASKTVLGRASEADLVLPDRAVSRLQCEVLARAGGYALVDRSGRGTPVSHRLAGEGGTLLKDGDEIRLGDFRVVFDGREPERGSDPTNQPRARTAPKTKSLAPGGERRKARLRVATDDGETTVALKAEEGFRLVVGAEPGPHGLVVKDEFVSGEHCRLAFTKGQWALTDLKSKNGTFVDRVRIGEAYLAGRAAVRVGETTLHFEEDAAATGDRDEPLPGLFSRDPAMVEVVEQVRRLSPARVAVAIHGETGSGKEVVARAIHELSERRDRPFVALNCGALPKELVESELFGHEKGAFTGADKPRAGAFEEANGGTLFLDAVGDLPLGVQVKLLRTLERGEIRRLGATRTQTVDVRLVSATHHDLLAAVENGAFREDLFYRLAVALVELPPLRQRPGDIALLAEQFVRQFMPDEPVGLSPSAKAKLEAHPWPGNARELRNVVQLALLHRRGPMITDDDVSFRPAAKRQRSLEVVRVAGRTLEDVERETYRLALERHGGDRRGAMEELGVARSTFFRRLEEFGLAREER